MGVDHGQGFASEEYLERFFDIPLMLPAYNPNNYVGGMFPTIFPKPSDGEQPEEIGHYAAFFELCSGALKLNLREKKKAIEFMRLALPAFPYQDSDASAKRLLLTQFTFVCALKVSSYTDIYAGLGDTIGDSGVFQQQLQAAVAAKFNRQLWYRIGHPRKGHLRHIMDSLYYNLNSYQTLRTRLNNLNETEIDAGDYIYSTLFGAIKIIGEGQGRLTKFATPLVRKGVREFQDLDTSFAQFIRRHVDYIGA